jgi:ribonuclease J
LSDPERVEIPEKTLRLVPLGGLGEIGMNCLALEQDGEIVVIDCGVTFPSQDLGIDVYHPRFDYLEARKDQVRAVVITHGHEDHVGALPYLLERLDVPVFAPPHALALARLRLREHGWKDEELRLHPITPRNPFEAGPFIFEPIRVTHSIADALALAIDTAAGLVIHTGDFKLDPGPQDGELTDEARFTELGERGVRLLLSDSTNVDSPGHTQSEEEVALALGELIAAAPNRVFVGMFASNVQRLLALGRIAERTGRRICLLGRSVVNHTQIAREVARLPWKSDLVVPPELAATMPRDRLIVLASGTQAERNAAMRRLASGTHPVLRLDEGDTVIFSSRVIPGNDRAVSELVDDLLRLGVHLVCARPTAASTRAATPTATSRSAWWR